MEWESGNAELHKRNSKFESFLKRTLPDEAFERIRAHEACIVVSEHENKTFKYAVVSDEKLYLTENPPKTVQEVLHFKDIISVELVNEFPEFLSGEERANTQHIAITYLTSEPKRRSFRRSKKSPRGSLTELSEIRSNASTPLSYISSTDGNFTEDTGSQTQSTTSLPRLTNHNSAKAGTQTKKKKTPGGNDVFEHSILKSLKEEIEEDVLENSEKDKLPVINSAVQSSRSFHNVNAAAKSESRNVLTSHRIVVHKLETTEMSTKMTRNGFTEKLQLFSSSQQSLRILPPVKVTKASFSETEIKKFMRTSERKEVDRVDIKGCCLFFKNYRGHKNQVTPMNKNDVHTNNHLGDVVSLSSNNPNLHGNSQLSDLNRSIGDHQPPSRASSVKGSRSGTPLLDTECSNNDLTSSFSDFGQSSSSFIGLSTLSVDGVNEKRKCVINIYLLTLTSNFLVLTKSAWNNYMIRSTLALEPEQVVISTKPVALSKKNRDKVECQYNQIKRDLFKKKLPLEDQYVLIDQLCSTTKSNIILKKFFWRSSDMLSFMVTQLQKYVLKSSASLNTNEGKAQRADEIQYIILILSVINLMLRETEILPSRLQTLKLEGGKLVSELLKIIMIQPDLPDQPLTLVKHWSAPATGGRKSDSSSDVNDELARLRTEYIHASISLVFEFILVAKQVQTEETSVLTVSGITAQFHEFNAMERFLDCLLSQIMEMVNISRFDILSPVQALLVFQIFSLLLIFLDHSKVVVSYIRNKYYEEFRYFIQASAVSRRLPDHYPIKAVTVSLIDQVVVKVLGTLPPHSSQDF